MVVFCSVTDFVALFRLLLKSNKVSNCDFSDSDPGGSSIKMSGLSGNIFKNCSLKEAELVESYTSDCDFTGADPTGTVFKYGGTGRCITEDTVMNRTSFISMHLADMVFGGTLEDCFFENCVFTRVRFENATLVNTFFRDNRKLKRISFINCKADLTGITLLD